MKKIAVLLMLVLWTCQAFAACDETCKRDKAMKEHNVTFPSYLTAKYCKTTSVDFLLHDLDSLKKYRNKQLPGGHKGGMHNIGKMLKQRKEWLVECDNYLRLTGQGRVFQDKKTTEKIFAAIDQVTEELHSLIYNGNQEVHVTSGLGLAEQRFDHLFTLLDHHKTELQLRGQLVVR